MKTSQRILTDILRDQPGHRLYVLDLVLNEYEFFELWKYYGNLDAERLIRRKIISSEYYDTILTAYEKALNNKLKKKEFRQMADGEAVVSPALVKALKPQVEKTKKVKKALPTQKEHRKLQL